MQGRVAIDRFTGGALESALFDEAPFWPDGTNATHVGLRIGLEFPQDCEVGLLLLAFKDLWLGDLPLGGETGIGRGVFQGARADITLPDGEKLSFEAVGDNPVQVKFTRGDWRRAQQLIQSLPQEAAKWKQPTWEVASDRN